MSCGDGGFAAAKGAASKSSVGFWVVSLPLKQPQSVTALRLVHRRVCAVGVEKKPPAKRAFRG